MKKSKIFISLIICIIVSITLVSTNINAEEINLKSTKDRRFKFTDMPSGETVLIETNDIYKLNEEIEDLKNYLNTFNQVPEDTYYYKTGTEGTNTIERYKFIDGAYYECDENGVVAEGAVASAIDPALLTEYTIVNASNLSEGIAAFKDKNIILGSGIDKALSYQNGYSDGSGANNITEQELQDSYNNGYSIGYEKGKEEAFSDGNVTKVYHMHEGNSSTNGGCYMTPIYHAHGNDCYNICAGTLEYTAIVTENQTQEYTCKCLSCSNEYVTADTSVRDCQQNILSCVKTEDIIDEYELSCGKTEDTIESITIVY